MDHRGKSYRVLAFDLRAQRTGFAILEGPSTLLDHGSVSTGSAEKTSLADSILGLCRLCDPAVIVVKRERWEAMTADSKRMQLGERVERYAAERCIQLQFIEGRRLNQIFLSMDCKTKVELAATLAMIFPELAWRLPPKRKIWQSEHRRQTAFDAIALAVGYWKLNAAQPILAENG